MKKETKLSKKELLRKQLVLNCISGSVTTKEAAMLSGLSQRRIQQNIADYKKHGDKIFVHGNKGLIRNNPTENARKEKIIKIFKETLVNGKNPFFDMSYKYFSEILFSEYGIKASPPYIKKLLASINHKSPRKHGCKKDYKIHITRERKEHFGELIQADGKIIDLFHDGHKYCIQGFVDDSTGYPVGLYVTKNECLLGYIEATRNMITQFGVPQQLYLDRASVFFVNIKPKDDLRHLTQFGLIMENFGVDMFPAYSPQAKGRIERFWGTLQGRLPQLLVMKGISTVEEVNIFLRDSFYEIYKNWFPKPPKSDESFFVSADVSKINSLLKAVYPGKTDKGGVFSFKGYLFLCDKLVNQKILINLNEKDGLWVTKPTDPTNKRYEVRLVESNTTGRLAEVYKDLIDRVFMKNAKPKYKEVYIDIDDIIYSEVKPKKTKS